MRADADRNRLALIESGRVLFAHGAADPSMRAVADHAGVGVGTLYRNFATREMLVAAVYADEIAQLGETDSLLAGRTAADALAGWFERFIAFTRTKHAMYELLHAPGSGPVPSARAEVTKALATILAAGVRDHSLRDDVDAEDLLRASTGIWRTGDTHDPEWERRARRLARLIIDGLRRGSQTEMTM
jgi:AcrR family transcriptional regulator